ncbi:MAG: biotin synthase BioB [Planctomycetes bacterium]|nr:biotin synthase BioB [Planctomycetota bacterium]
MTTATLALSADPAAIAQLADAVCAGSELGAAQGRELLEVVPGPAQDALLAGARRIRAHFHGAALKCCSILNVKAGNCSENCSYCAQASGSTATSYDKTKWLPDEDIAAAAASSAANGAGALGLVAAWKGVKEGSQLEMVCKAVEKLAANGQVRADVSLGILESQVCADRLHQAGARVYGHNIETARSFYPSICSSHSFEDRLRTVEYIKKAGMGLCSGGIFGMGESRDQRIEFIEQLRYIQPDMIPINFLNPLQGTKLDHLPVMPADEALTTLATCRFMLPDRNLMVAGGKEVVFGARLAEVLDAGINAIMVGNYLTSLGTPGEFWNEQAAARGLALTPE